MKVYSGKTNFIKDRFYRLIFTTSLRFKLFIKIKAFLEQGVDILTVLTSLRNAYAKLDKKFDVRVYVLDRWIYEIDVNAKPFYEAIRGWATENEALLIQSGEISGRLVDAMENAISTTEAASTAIKTVRGKMAYPVILVAILFAMAYMFATKIVPEFEKLSPPSQWPTNAQDLYNISAFIREDWATLILGIIGGAFVISYIMKNVGGPIRQHIDKLPIFNMYRSFQSSLFLVSLASMMKSGVDIEKSLFDIRKNASPYLKHELNKVYKRMDDGLSPGEAFDTPFFDEETRVDIGIYANSKNIGDSIEVIGKSAIKNGVEKISAAADIVKFLLMMGIVFYIGWSYFGFYTLVQSISQNVG